LDARKDANGIVRDGDITGLLIVEFRKVDMEMLDIACVFTTDCLKEQGYALRGGYGKIKAILGVEERDGFVVEGLVRAEEARAKLMSLIETSP
jgi:hypothetical protein